MIQGIEKTEKCDKRVKAVLVFLETIYKEIIVTSGYRSPEDNARAGGAKNSMHMQGLAGDVIVPERKAFVIAGRILDAFSDVKGMGVNPYLNYVHFDFRPEKDLVCWVYSKMNEVA